MSALEATSQRLIFTHVYDGGPVLHGTNARSRLFLVNPHTSPATVRVRLRGQVTRALTLELEPGGFEVLEVSDLVGASGTTVTGGWIEAEALQGRGLAGSLLVEFPDADTVLLLNGQAGSGSLRLYAAQLAHVPGALFSRLAVVNTADSPRHLRLRAVADDGGELVPPRDYVLESGGWLEADAAQLLGFAGAAVGSLVVEADGPGLAGDIFFGDPGGLAFGAVLPLQDRPFRKAAFSHLADLPRVFFTGLAVFFPGSEEDANIKVDVYQSDGSLTGSREFRLGAGMRRSETLAELVPESRGQVGGYVVVSADRPVVAQQLFGTPSLTAWSVVPPTVLE
jgi:hypothetical protein